MVRRKAREDLKCFTLDNGEQFVMTSSTILMLVSSAEVSDSGLFSRLFGVYTVTTHTAFLAGTMSLEKTF